MWSGLFYLGVLMHGCGWSAEEQRKTKKAQLVS